MGVNEDFAAAQEKVKTLKEKPSNADLLELYSLFKQGSVGDATGSRPAFYDMVGRAKFDAWAAKKGTKQDEAKQRYVALVEKLFKQQG
jgi:acyl-CoA-binding protein